MIKFIYTHQNYITILTKKIMWPSKSEILLNIIIPLINLFWVYHFLNMIYFLFKIYWCRHCQPKHDYYPQVSTQLLKLYQTSWLRYKFQLFHLCWWILNDYYHFYLSIKINIWLLRIGVVSEFAWTQVHHICWIIGITWSLSRISAHHIYLI